MSRKKENPRITTYNKLINIGKSCEKDILNLKIEDLKAYEVIEKREIADIKSVTYLCKHKKTGARVALVSNDDENKVFYINRNQAAGQQSGADPRAYVRDHVDPRSIPRRHSAHLCRPQNQTGGLINISKYRSNYEPFRKEIKHTARLPDA